MVVPLLLEKSVTTGVPLTENTAFVSLVVDEYAKDTESAHASLFFLSPTFAKESFFIQEWVAGLAVSVEDRDEIVAVTEWGTVIVVTPEGEFEAPEISLSRGPIRSISEIDGSLFAVGAGHQVFVCDENKDWNDISPGEELRKAFPDDIFHGIDGFSQNDLYVAGMYGRIWHYDGSQWSVVQTSTNLAYLGITCAEDQKVYACGQTGIIVAGRNQEFELIVPANDLDDLWSLQHYNGKLYVSAMRALLELNGDELVLCSPAMEVAGTFYTLKICDGVLWSFGEKDVLRLNGNDWSSINEVTVEYK